MAKLGLQQSPLEAALQQAEPVSYGLPDDLKKQFEQDRIKAESRRKNTDQQYDARVTDLSSRNAAVTGGATWDRKLTGSTSFIQNNPDVFAGYSPQQMHWIAAISAQESAGNPTARSPVGAFGLMQVMPATGQNPGYGIKPLRDSSVRENVRLGLGKFEAMMSRFNGDVDKALAAYNAGEGNVDKAVARARKFGGDWKAYLPRPQETIPYINNVKGYYNAIGSKGGVPTSAAQPAPTKQATTADSRYRPLSETELKRMQEAQAQGLDTFVPFAGAKPIKIGQQPGKKAPKQENEDAGFLSDTGNLLLSGVNSSVEAAHEIAGRLPGISIGAAALDKIEEYFTGKTPQQIFKEVDEKYNKKLSNETAEARKKRWIIEPGDDLGNGKKAIEYSFGDAWKDPRAYYAGIVESAPEMVATMGGSLTLAKGAFKAALKSGATREVASKKAATTATIAGGLLEGSFGGAHASIDVRKEINGMSADMLKNSDVMKALMAEGKTFEQARNQLANDAATKAFVLAGVGTGIFGGMGDRAIAQVITKGTSSRLKSAVGGAIGEGLLEEAPQSALQQMAQNYAVQDADPNRPLSKGVANAAAGGAVLGGVMGGGIGAAGHRADVPQVDQPVAETPQAEEVPQAAAEAPVQDVVPEQPIQVEQPPRKVGPLERALGGEESLNTAIDNEIDAVAADQWLGVPGTVTKISPKADSESVYTVTVEGYENGEVFARDQDGTPMQFGQDDIVSATPVNYSEIPNSSNQDNTAPSENTRTDGETEFLTGGATIVHGSGNSDLKAEDVTIVRVDGQKQGKKGRKYGGFYGTSEADASQAEGYAEMMGGSPTLYDVKIKAGTKVLKKTGDVTRLSENYINELVAQGYGVVVGKDPRGRTEYVVIDKNAIESMNARPGKNTGTEQGHAHDLTDFDYTPKQPTKAAEDPNLSTFDTNEGQSVNPEPVKKVEIEQPEKTLGKMSEDELRARVKYLADKAKTNGGWTKRLMSERNKVEKALANLAKAQHQVEENQKPPTTADAIKHGMAEISRGMDEGARNQVAEYIREGNTDRLTYRKEDAINAALSNPNYNVQRNDDGSVTVIGVKTADGAWHGVSRSDAQSASSFKDQILDAHVNNPAKKAQIIADEIKATGRTRSDVFGEVSRIVDEYEANKPNAEATDETPAPLMGANGKPKWFFSRDKAEAFITKKKLGDQYQVNEVSKNRFEIHPIAAATQDTAPSNAAPTVAKTETVQPEYSFDNESVNSAPVTQPEVQPTEQSQPEVGKYSDKDGWSKVNTKSQSTDVYSRTQGDTRRVVHVNKKTGEVTKDELRTTPNVVAVDPETGEEFTFKIYRDSKNPDVITDVILYSNGKMEQSLGKQGKQSDEQFIKGYVEATDLELVEPTSETPVQDEVSSEPESTVKGGVSHLDNYPEQANKPLDQWDHNDFSSVGMSQRYTGGDGTRLSLKEESQANRLIAKMIPKIIKRGVEAGKSTSEIMQEVYELADKDYAMRQSGVASLEALIERERTAKGEGKPQQKKKNTAPVVNTPKKKEDEATPKPKVEVSENRLVSDDRAAELRARLKAKLSQLNSGIDPEILAIGAELAVYHIERGARKFAALAKNIANDLDVSVEKIRPYLRSWYNGARDMMEDMGADIQGMDSADTVRAELAKLDNPQQSDDEVSRNKSDLQENEVNDVEPTQKLKDVMERSKQYVHSVKQVMVDEHHFLNVGSSVLTGQPVYTLWNDQGNYFRADVDSIKPNATFSQAVIDQAKAVKQKTEQQDAELVKKYPNGVFSGTDAQVVTTENVPKKVKEYLDSLLKMLGMDTRVFLTTAQDMNSPAAQEKYHIYGGHRSILSTQVNAEESGATRLISINQSDFKDAYIVFNSGMSEEAMIEVIAHELGHIIEKTLLKSASQETQNAIKADFQQWLGSVKGVSKREHLALMRNRHIAQMNMQDKASIMDTSNANLSPYWFSFSEWFADQVSRWTTTSEKPLSLVEKFFASVAKKLKQLAQIVNNTKESYQPSVSVRDYLNSIARTDFLEELYPQQSDGESGATGKTETVVTPSGREFEVRHKLVDVSDLIVSNTGTGAINPNYPQQLQPRDRTRLASQNQINEIASKLNPRLLGESVNAAEGAPIVSNDNVVESGNGRTLAVRQAYERGLANDYRQWLEDQGYDTEGMAMPMLVRERVTPMTWDERTAYTKEANERTTLELSPAERATMDAQKIGPILYQFKGGEIDTSANRPFVRAFIDEIVSPSDRGGMLEGGGQLSQAGKRRIQAALVAKAYGDETLITDMFESVDSDIKAIGGALMDVSGEWASMRDGVQNGTISGSVDVTPNLMEAVNIIRRARAEGRTVFELVNQDDIFAGETDPVTRGFVSVFYRGENLTRARGRDKVAGALRHYAQQALATHPGENMFGDPEIKGSEILRNTNERLQNQEADKQQDLLSSTPVNEQNTGMVGERGQRSVVEAQSQVTAEAAEVAPTPADTFEQFNDVAKQYGRTVNENGEIISQKGKPTGVFITEKKGRVRIEQNGKLLFSGANAQSLGKFLEDYWYDTKVKAATKADPEETAPLADGKTKHEMTIDGRRKDGGPIMPGHQFVTSSGRLTTPYPKKKSERYASQWLIDNAVDEAKSRGDRFNSTIFASYKPLKDGTLSTADREGMLMYLYGEQPAVVRSIFKDDDGIRYSRNSALAKLRDTYGYRDSHLAPDADGGFNSHQLANVYPDLNSRTFAREYGDGRPYDAKTVKIMREMQKNPEGEITVYRAVPAGIEANTLNYGDWVAITKDYAIEHGNSRFDGKYKIIEQKVKGSDLYTDGNSIDEWGYSPQGHEVEVAKTRLKEQLERLNNTLDQGPYRSRISMADVLQNHNELRHKPSLAKAFLDSIGEKIEPIYEKDSLSNELKALSDQVKASESKYDLIDNRPELIDQIFDLVEVAKYREQLNSPLSRVRTRAQTMIDAMQNFSAEQKGRIVSSVLDEMRAYDPKNTERKINETATARNAVELAQAKGEQFDQFIDSRLRSMDNDAETILNSRAANVSTSQLSPSMVRGALVKRFGEAAIAKLERDGVLSIVESFDVSGVEGYAVNGKVTLVADALNPQTIIPTFLHELGGHVGFQGVMNPNAYQNLMDQFNKLVKANDPIALEAKRLAEREINPETQEVEYLPYLITVAARQQNNRPGIRTLINRIIAAVKAWAFDRLGLSINLNANDVLALSERMVDKVAYQQKYAPAEQRYSYAGKKAWYSDLDKLDQARSMKENGISDGAIRNATGWFTGQDGNWRFEIDDSRSQVKNLDRLSKDTYTRLEEIYEHDELFRNYPVLQDYAVRLVDSDNRYDGILHVNRKTISINERHIDNAKYVREILAHELQHAIQGIEDFAQGGSINEQFAASVKNNLQTLKQTKQWELDDRLSESAWAYSERDRLRKELRNVSLFETVKNLRKYANMDKPSSQLRHVRNNFNMIVHLDHLATMGEIESTQEQRYALRDIQRDWYVVGKRTQKQFNPRLKDVSWRAADLIQQFIDPRMYQELNVSEASTKSIKGKLERRINKLYQEIAPTEAVKREVADFGSKVDRLMNASPSTIYMALAGEIESRDVEARIDMTPEERQRTLPYSSQDEYNDRAIVVRDNRLQAMSVRETDEVAAVREQYQGTDQWMKAPNGKDTNLNEQQWLQVRTPSFKNWFGDWENDAENASKVVDENGEPMVVYHGTDAEFTQFDASYDGAFGSGIYLTNNLEDAEQYGDNAMSLYAKIEKPYQTVADYDAGENYDLDSPAVPMILDLFGKEADSIIERLQDGDDTVGGEIQSKLISKGYDGVQIEWGDGLTQFVAFSPEQIKSATDNTGAFDPNNPDIRFSRRDEDLAPVSEQEYASKLSQWWSEAKKLPSDKLTKLMTDGGLGLIPLRPMLTEMAKDIPAATSYLRIKDAMDAMRNKWHAKTDAVAQEWLKYRIKNKEENRELMDLMHESTLNQVDPSMPFQSLMTPKERMALKNPNLNANLRLELTAKMELDAKREEAYDVLKSRYDSLSSEAQSLYKSVRDAYSDLADAFDETLLKNMEKAINVRIKKAEREHSREMERITDEGLQGQERDDAIAAADRRLKNAKTKIAWNRKARMTQLRKQFETQRLAGPYFPLARFGNLFVTVRDAKSGEVVSFSRFEDPTEQRKFAEEMKKEAGYKVEEGALIGEAAVRKAVDPNFVADVEDILADLPNAEQVKDEVWQRYLESLPDMSVRKSRIHRKGRAGFNADAVRAFGHHMFHGSHQLARMAHSMDLEDALDQAKDDARTSKDPKRSSLIVNEMEKRHQFIMNPTGGALAQWASSFAFVWYLAGSPKAAIMNLFQTPIMATPILGAYAGGLNGIARAGKELTKAAIDFTKGKGFAERSSSLTAEERQAMADGYESGVIERTQGHDLAGVGETGVEYSAARERAMKIISWGFHHAERFNREVTFLAAYRLARAKGLSHEAAVGKAGELTWKSHFDYSNTSRPRLMHSDTMKVLLVFRNFQINMLYRLFRDVHQAVNGESKEVRREALTHLAGITGMMMLNAGITGTWLFGIAMVMAGLFMEDGEEPDEELKKAMIKVLGPRLAGMALHGLPGYITGTSLSGSAGMPDLWFRSPDSEKEGQEALQYWQSQLLGAVPGIAAQFVSGWDKIKKGEEYRGIETMMPKMFKDPMKAYRYMTEGAKNMRGDTVTEVTNPDVIKQALGFTPARIAEQYKINNASYNLQQTIMKERKRIMDDYYKAEQEGDEAKVNELIKKIEKYNEKNPEQAITARSIMQSRKNREKGAENAVGGMRYNSKLRDRLMEEQAPTIYGE